MMTQVLDDGPVKTKLSLLFVQQKKATVVEYFREAAKFKRGGHGRQLFLCLQMASPLYLFPHIRTAVVSEKRNSVAPSSLSDQRVDAVSNSFWVVNIEPCNSSGFYLRCCCSSSARNTEVMLPTFLKVTLSLSLSISKQVVNTDRNALETWRMGWRPCQWDAMNSWRKTQRKVKLLLPKFVLFFSQNAQQHRPTFFLKIVNQPWKSEWSII